VASVRLGREEWNGVQFARVWQRLLGVERGTVEGVVIDEERV